MSETLALRASDVDRERAIVLLREHAVAGRLTLEEFTDRMSAASRAVTKAELDELTRDLPAAPVPVATSRRGPTRIVVALFGSSEREGRLRVRGRVACLAAFGSVDLDLRRATLEPARLFAFRPQGPARERAAAATRHSARARLGTLPLRRHRRMARPDRLDGEDMARSDPRDPLRRPQGARGMSVARLRLAPVGETMFPPRQTPFFLSCVGEPPGSPTPPPHAHRPRVGL